MVRHTTPVQHATFVFHVYVLAFHESARRLGRLQESRRPNLTLYPGNGFLNNPHEYLFVSGCMINARSSC